MKLIVCGGRDYIFTDTDKVWLAMICQQEYVEEIVSGGQTGADACGEQFARQHAIDLTIMFAKWTQFGRRAGPIRNGVMADLANAVAVFPGGVGTANMLAQAERKGLRVFESPSRLETKA